MTVQQLRRRTPGEEILFLQDEKGRHLAAGSNAILTDVFDERQVVKFETGYHGATFGRPVILVSTKEDKHMSALGLILTVIGAAAVAAWVVRLAEWIGR